MSSNEVQQSKKKKVEMSLRSSMIRSVKNAVAHNYQSLEITLLRARLRILWRMKQHLTKEEIQLLYSANGKPNTDINTYSIRHLCFVLSCIFQKNLKECIDVQVLDLSKHDKRDSLSILFDGTLEECIKRFDKGLEQRERAGLYKCALSKTEDVVNEMLVCHPFCTIFQAQSWFPFPPELEISRTAIQQQIIDHVKAKGKDGYEMFKECLTKSKQSMLRNYLETVMIGGNTDEYLRRLREEARIRKEKEEHIREVLRKAHRVIKEYLDTQLIVDAFKEDKFITQDMICAIENLPSKCSKFVHIYGNVFAKGVYGYEKFKTYLIQTDQRMLNEYLEKLENGEEVKQDDQLIMDSHATKSVQNQTENRSVIDDNKDLRVASESGSEDKQLHERILNRSVKIIKEYLIPQPILDDFEELEFLPFTKIRDTRESTSTTKKNEDIINYVRAKGKAGYEVFEECLKNSKQNLLHTYLVKLENGEDTAEIVKLLQKERKARDKVVRKENRKQEIKEKNIVNSMEEQLIFASKKGVHFKGKQDIEETVKVKGSTDINRQSCSHTIKCIFDQNLGDIFSEQIIEAANKIASSINVEMRKTSIDENNGIVITMTCSSSEEMIALLKTLNGDTFQTKIHALNDAFAKEYGDNFAVKAKLSPEKILVLHNNLRDQGIIEKRDGHSICDQHAEEKNEYFCPNHNVFCCDRCATSDHRECEGLRQITTDPVLEADDENFPKYKKDYRVRVIGETDLCTAKRVCVLSNSKILIADNANNRLKKLDMCYKVDSHCQLTCPPFDVCVFDDTKVLMCFGHKVSFVDIRGALTTERELTLKIPCYSIALHDDAIYYTDHILLATCNKNGDNHQELYRFGEEEEKTTCYRLVVRKDGMKTYIAAGERGLITIDIIQKKHYIFLCRQLKMCTDICLVNSKCLLACDYKSHAVYLLDVEREIILKTVADSSNGLHLPRSIDFDVTDSTLVVGHLGRDFISVFEIKLEM